MAYSSRNGGDFPLPCLITGGYHIFFSNNSWGLKPARNEDMVDNRHLRCWCKNCLRVWGWGDDLFNGDCQSGMELVMAMRSEFPSLGPYGIF